MANIKKGKITDPTLTWREFFKGEYLSYYDLVGGDETVTISEMKHETVTGPGGKKDDKLVARFTNPDILPMVMNVTNSKTITELYGTNKPAEWTGKSVVLFADPNVSRGGEMVGGIRIRPYIPQVKKRTLNSEQFDKMKTAIKSGKFDKKNTVNYALTEAQQKEVDAL